METNEISFQSLAPYNFPLIVRGRLLILCQYVLQMEFTTHFGLFPDQSDSKPVLILPGAILSTICRIKTMHM